MNASHSRPSRRIWSIAGLVVGAFLVVLGVGLVAAYVFSAVLDRIGEPDQSLLFWYLPLLFIGIMTVAAGLGAGIAGLLTLRKPS